MSDSFKNKPIRFGIIGCGYVAHRHASNIVAHPDAELAAVFDIKSERTQQFAEKYATLPCQNFEEMLTDSTIDIITVCTPNGHHHTATLAALNANKHVLVEKPMAIRKEYCEEMISLALAKNKSLFVVKQNRFNPPVQAVKQLMKNNKLGRIFSVGVNCYWNRNEQYYAQSAWRGTKNMDGGTLFTQFSHFVDILYYLFGDIEVKSGLISNVNHGTQIEFEDTGHFIFRLKQHNALGQMSYTTAAFQQNMEGSITIFAENATIKIGGKYLNTIDYQCTDGFDIEGLPSSGPANNYGFYQGSMSNHDRMVANTVATLQGKESIISNAYDGLKVVEIIEQLYDKATWIKD